MAGPERDADARSDAPAPKPAIPGHFVSSDQRTDTERFLDHVKSLVRQREEAREKLRRRRSPGL